MNTGARGGSRPSAGHARPRPGAYTAPSVDGAGRTQEPAGPTVLVVDDDRPTADLLGALVRAELGGTAVTAADGAEALLVVRAFPVDAVLLDLNLPGIDGIELCRRLRAERGLAEAPILVVSGRSRDTDVAEALAAGASDYVQKPFEVADLAARLRELIAAGRDR
jgi:DNA-binding response OmpR family regulator